MASILKVKQDGIWIDIPAIKGEKGDKGDGSSWAELTGKPFASIDSGTLKVENNVLKVDVVDSAIQDNTKPITSNAVALQVGNINALLELI